EAGDVKLRGPPLEREPERARRGVSRSARLFTPAPVEVLLPVARLDERARGLARHVREARLRLHARADWQALGERPERFAQLVVLPPVEDRPDDELPRAAQTEQQRLPARKQEGRARDAEATPGA